MTNEACIGICVQCDAEFPTSTDTLIEFCSLKCATNYDESNGGDLDRFEWN